MFDGRFELSLRQRSTNGRAVTEAIAFLMLLVGFLLFGQQEASADQTIRSGRYPTGFEVPAGETWTFDPHQNVTVTSGGNVVVRGTLVIRPDDDVTHILRFTGINETNFQGGGDGTVPIASDVGLWVVGSGRVIIEGKEKRAWGYEFDPAWKGDEVIAAPNTPGDFDGFRKVTSTPPPNALGYRTELLNLTRNVRIEGEPDGYTHVMIRSSRPSTIRYAALRYVAPNPARFSSNDSTGRYGIHIHLAGNGSRGTLIEGVVIRDANNHAFVPHGSHGITFRDTIAYNVRSEAYWWDDPAPGHHNESADIVFDRAVAALIRGAAGGNHHRLAAFYLGAGHNPTVVNSVVVGMQNEGGANRSAYLWPEDSEASWNFKGNVAHNNDSHGIHVWQNNELPHLIENFTAYYNSGAGVNHGAYKNSYEYVNLVLLHNGLAVHSHALGEPGDGGAPTQSWSNLKTNGGALYIDKHELAGERPVLFRDCDFGRVIVDDAEGSAPGLYDFVRCGLEPSDFDLRNAHPGGVFRVQRANGTAYRLTADGRVTSISPFAPLEPPNYEQNGFSDIAGSVFAADIEWLANRGITRGCNPPQNNRFCPNDFVTRGQMAAFLVRALKYSNDGGGNRFVDDNGSVFEGDIQRLAAAGVTQGCNPPQNNRFCPNDFVTRGQMAAFLHRALGN